MNVCMCVSVQKWDKYRKGKWRHTYWFGIGDLSSPIISLVNGPMLVILFFFVKFLIERRLMKISCRKTCKFLRFWFRFCLVEAVDIVSVDAVQKICCLTEIWSEDRYEISRTNLSQKQILLLEFLFWRTSAL